MGIARARNPGASPIDTPVTRHRRSGRLARLTGWIAAAWVAVAVLAGCATGRADEARLAATREATRGAELPAAEATNVVREFFMPTATPLPTATPPPTLATLTLATSLGSNNQPANEIENARNGSTIYAVAEIHGLRAGQTATAVWTTVDGFEVYRSSIAIDRSLDAAWVPFRWDISGVASGQYAVYVYVDERLLNSLVFGIG